MIRLVAALFGLTLAATSFAGRNDIPFDKSNADEIEATSDDTCATQYAGACIVLTDDEGYETVECGAIATDDPGDPPSPLMTWRQCVSDGGTPAQPYASTGDNGWYCTGFLGAPSRIDRF